MTRARVLAPLRALPIVCLVCAPFALAQLPYGSTPGSDVYAYAEYLFIGNGDCSSGSNAGTNLPSDFDCTNDWKYNDFRDSTVTSSDINQNPQEFYGVRGVGTNSAWEVSTGRPDTVIAVLDSGIRWEDNRQNLLKKYYLNRGELPLPRKPDGAGGTQEGNPSDTRFGGYDLNGDGIFNVVDYWQDTRASDLNGNGDVDPEDLIRTFSDSVDDDGNGYVDDISGWDFFENDNNPQDDTDYGHGTGEAIDSGGEAGLGGDGQCPNCMLMVMRVGDSFIADVNHFGEAVVYATDNGASVVQEALGTLNHTSFGQAAVDYAYRKGVIVNASEADEAAGHHNWPAAYDKTMVINSIRTSSIPAVPPQSYLFFNGCTNFGGYTFLSIPSTSCSSEAAGRSSGVSGLLYSAARNAMDRGSMTGYVNDAGVATDWPLSAEEAMQLWRLSADDIDFSSTCPGHAFCDDAPAGVVAPLAPLNNYAPIPTPDSTRYQTVKGWDYFTGYGRSNAARLVRFIGIEGHSTLADREYVPKAGGVENPYGVGSDALTAQDRIPPEANIAWPRRWHQYPVVLDAVDGNRVMLPDDPASPSEVVVHGRAAANRVTAAGGSFDYVVEWAPHVQGQKSPVALAQASTTCAQPSQELSGGPWTQVTCVQGLTAGFEGELARIPIDDLLLANSLNPNPFDPATDPTSEFQPERFAIRLRLRVIAHPINASDLVNNEAVHQKQIDVYVSQESSIRDDLGVPISSPLDPGIAQMDALNVDGLGRYAGGAGSPSFHDLDGDGVDEMVIQTTDGVVHAFTDLSTGAELPGWPVTTDFYPGVSDALAGDGSTAVNNAYTRGDVTSEVYGSLLVGTAAVADLDDDGTLEVIAGDLEGKAYVWEHDGTRRPGFPVSVDFSLSKEVNCTAATIPACDDYETGPHKRDIWNQRDWGINSPPVIGDLDRDRAGLEIVFSANDTHVYAFYNDGTPVPGWPVILRDPAKLSSMDPTTRFYAFAPDAGQEIGSKILPNPSIGDIDGDGFPEVVIGVNEEYDEPPNSDIVFDPAITAIGALNATGNTRVYALRHTGAATPDTPATAVTAHTQDQAYVPGWPVPITLAVLDLLPYVGAGVNTQLPLFDADGDDTLEIAAASAAGPAYILRHDGQSFLQPNGVTGNYRTLESEVFGPLSTSTDTPTLVGVGGLAVGSLDGGGHISVVGPGAGLLRLLDIVLEADQIGPEDHIVAWNATTGQFEPGAPLNVNDLQFFTSPIVADVTGDGLAEMIQGTAVSDTVAANLVTGGPALRFFTGGWHVNAASVGAAPLGAAADGFLQIASVTREGYLRTWPSLVTDQTPLACTSLSQWPEYGHDAHNSGNLHHDAERPYPVQDLTATPGLGGNVTLDFTATGDDRGCGTAKRYRARAFPGTPSDPQWVDGQELYIPPSLLSPLPAGLADSVSVGPLAPGSWTLLLRAVDEQGNGSAPVAVSVVVP